MDNVIVVGTNNEKANIYVVRYFQYNNKKYLIYTLNEKDETGYVKLYVSKVVEQNGTIFANGITDEDEWTEIKDLIKTIIKEVREGELKSAKDLNPSVLNNSVIVDFRAFKLVANIVEILSTNKNVENEEDGTTVEPALDTFMNNNDEVEVNNMSSFDELMNNNIENNTNEITDETSEYTPSYEEPTYQPDYSYESDYMTNVNAEHENNDTVSINNDNTDANIVYKELYEKLLEEKKQIEKELYELKSQMNVIRNLLEEKK